MSGLKDAGHLFRFAGLFVVAFLVFLVVRGYVVPKTFGEYGHYRGAALQEIANREPFWAGRNTCDTCHKEIVQKLAKAEHQGLSCETCHGPSEAHVKDPEVKLPQMGYDKCVRCHEASPSRPKWLHQVTVADHYTGNVCTECHDPHQPKP